MPLLLRFETSPQRTKLAIGTVQPPAPKGPLIETQSDFMELRLRVEKQIGLCFKSIAAVAPGIYVVYDYGNGPKSASALTFPEVRAHHF